MYKLTPKQELSNRLFQRFTEVMAPFDNWLFPLVDYDLDNQPDLRNRVYPLLFYAMCEVCHNFDERIKFIEQNPLLSEHKSAGFYIDHIKRYVSLMVEILGEFSSEDFLFLIERRHQIIHGRRDEAFKESKRVYSIEGDRVLIRKVPDKQYWSEFRKTMEGYGGMNEAHHFLRERFCNYVTPLWVLNGFLKTARPYILKDFHSYGRRDAVINLGEPSEFAKKFGQSLLSFRAEYHSPNTDPDPITFGKPYKVKL